MVERKLGYTFGRTEEGRDRDYAELEKRLAQQPVAPTSEPVSPVQQEENTQPQNQPINIPIVNYDLNKANPKHFAVLPARTHGIYSYPETAVCLYRLGKNSQVEEVGRYLGITTENTAKELTNKNEYIGNINWEQGMKIVLGLNGTPLTPRQGIDFLDLLVSNRAEDLEGNFIGAKECARVVREIIGKENPWRAEWLDANFKYLDSKWKPIAEDKKGTFYIDHSHKLQNGVLVPKREIMISHLKESKWLDLNSLLADSNPHGIPTTTVKDGQDIYFYKPSKDNNSVAGFYADSGRADFSCYRNPSGSVASLGVRYASPTGRAGSPKK